MEWKEALLSAYQVCGAVLSNEDPNEGAPVDGDDAHLFCNSRCSVSKKFRKERVVGKRWASRWGRSTNSRHSYEETWREMRTE